ncbi:MAG TPA: sigma-70 family RNA polymerase sigma factor [Acidimicrobiales bacterium]|jgi:RNA polymerase sigma-70 factor (ECF subfamily)|nr:sigma-70 family RNA polymerase sigma factor [Acidimicrobiales bacterium]
MTPPPPSDPGDLTTVVAEAVGGSVAAFERIYRELSPAVASYLRWNGVHDVESLTNEVMAQVHRNLGRFSGDAVAFRSWVFTIAHHRMVDERRAMARRPVTADAEISETSAVGDAEVDALDALSDSELVALLDRLSPDQREVLLLRVVADLSLEDVATALGKRRGAIKSLQHRALAALRRHLEREQVDHD